MTKIVVERNAEIDILEAFVWYEDQEPDLGKAFIAEVDAAVERIRENPNAFPAVYQLVRRILIRRFPYCIYFQVRTDAVVIFACIHASRSARTWRSRLQ